MRLNNITGMKSGNRQEKRYWAKNDLFQCLKVVQYLHLNQFAWNLGRHPFIRGYLTSPKMKK